MPGKADRCDNGCRAVARYWVNGRYVCKRCKAEYESKKHKIDCAKR